MARIVAPEMSNSDFAAAHLTGQSQRSHHHLQFFTRSLVCRNLGSPEFRILTNWNNLADL